MIWSGWLTNRGFWIGWNDMDVQQLKEVEKWVMGTMGVVLLVMWLFVKWALRKSKELEREEDSGDLA